MDPHHLKYARDHEWARAEGDRATVGITDYAQTQLSDIVYVDLPAVGAAVTGGRPFGEVESSKSVSDRYSPVSGTIVGRNDALDKNPELINADPYGQGWLIVVEMTHPGRARPADGRRGLRPDGRRSLTATARGGLWQAEGTGPTTRQDPGRSLLVSVPMSATSQHQTNLRWT